MYVEFIAYLENGTLPDDLEKKILEICPDWDTGCFENKDEEDGKEFATFHFGEDDFIDENGDNIECYLYDENDEARMNPAYEEAEKDNATYCYEIYMALSDLEESGEIINCWINNGGQYRFYPTKKHAQELIDKLNTPSV